MASSICTFLLSVLAFGPNLGRFKDDALGGNGVEPSVNPGVLLPTEARSSDQVNAENPGNRNAVDK